MTTKLQLDVEDLAILRTLDENFAVSADGTGATIRETMKIEVSRPAPDQLEFVLDFANVALPVVMLREKLLGTLKLKADES